MLLVGLRSRWDFFVTGIRGKWTYYGAILGLVVTVIGVPLGFRFGLPLVLNLAGLVLSIALLLPEWMRTRRSEDIAILEIPDADFRPAETDGEIVDVGREVAIRWSELDALLPTTPIACAFNAQRRTRLPRRVSRYAYRILEVRGRQKAMFNGQVVRQDTDLTPNLVREGGVVELSRTDYFTAICTNYLAGYRIVDPGHQVELEGNSLFLRKGRLVPLSQGMLANLIGVSTIAFTTDNKLALVYQDSHSVSSPGLTAPSGSGSVDLRDVHTQGAERSLSRFVTAAMERELAEECHLRYAEIGSTILLGYFRWLSKGGKPEYLGLTFLTRTSEELYGRRVRVVESPYVQQIVFDCTVDFTALMSDVPPVQCLEHRYRDAISMPLHMALLALREALRRNDEVAASLQARFAVRPPRR